LGYANVIQANVFTFKPQNIAKFKVYYPILTTIRIEDKNVVARSRGSARAVDFLFVLGTLVVLGLLRF